MPLLLWGDRLAEDVQEVMDSALNILTQGCDTYPARGNPEQGLGDGCWPRVPGGAVSGTGVSGRQRQPAVRGDERITDARCDKRCDAERFSRVMRRSIDRCIPVHYYFFYIKRNRPKTKKNEERTKNKK